MKFTALPHMISNVFICLGHLVHCCLSVTRTCPRSPWPCKTIFNRCKQLPSGAVIKKVPAGVPYFNSRTKPHGNQRGLKMFRFHIFPHAASLWPEGFVETHWLEWNDSRRKWANWPLSHPSGPVAAVSTNESWCRDDFKESITSGGADISVICLL